MSNSSGISQTEKFLGRKSGKVVEKSNFAQACYLLSRYLKERGNLGDLSRGMSGILETKGRSEAFRPAVTTMNLLPSMDRPAAGDVAGKLKKPLDFFPPFAGARSSGPVEYAVNNKSDSGKPARIEPETAQLTIFYAGKVVVYNDFPADKAREIMSLASKGNPNKNQSHFVPTSSGPINPSSSAASNMVPTTTTSLSDVAVPPTQKCLQTPPQAIGPADMPLTRSKSLHRFLEKRKERATVRAPYYQVMNKQPFGTSSSQKKTEESNSMADMEEAQPSEQLQLKL